VGNNISLGRSAVVIVFWHSIAAAHQLIKQIEEEQSHSARERILPVLQPSGSPATVPMMLDIPLLYRWRISGMALIFCALSLPLAWIVVLPVKRLRKQEIGNMPVKSATTQVSSSSPTEVPLLGNTNKASTRLFPHKLISSPSLQPSQVAVTSALQPIEVSLVCFPRTLPIAIPAGELGRIAGLISTWAPFQAPLYYVDNRDGGEPQQWPTDQQLKQAKPGDLWALECDV
jgi:hypothetical protein